MSEDKKADATVRCASCGIVEIDDIKLKECDGCDLVKYCSDECKRDHIPAHEEACKKRAAELRDEILFKQPESTHLGDCPICSLPLPIERSKSSMYYCCSKLVCDGCDRAYLKRQLEMRLALSCPFCRESITSGEGTEKQMMKRMEANDPVAICYVGVEQFKKRKYHSAFEYWTKAAELGDARSHYELSLMYMNGLAVEKDEGKQIYHLKEAAIAGHPGARYNLGCCENDNGNAERAVKHFIIAATQGEDDGIKALIKAFKQGFVSKEDLATALRAHKAAVDATRSPQRKEAEDFLRRKGLM